MQSQPSPRTQRAVLALALHEHPTPLTDADLAREVGPDVAEAVADLIAVGLLRREGEAIHPTAAALRFEELA